MRTLATYGLALALALAAVARPLGAAAELPLTELRRSYAQAADSLNRLTARRDSLSARLEVVSAQVARLKQSGAQNAFSPVEQYRLGESLRAGQSLADSLDRLNVARFGLTHWVEAQRATLGSALNVRLERLAREPQTAALSAEADALRRERAALAAVARLRPESGTVPTLATRLQVEPDDSPEDLRDKADFASDLARRVERGLGLVHSELRRVREESAVRRRTGEFAQEMALFDEGLTLRRSGSRGGSEASTTDKSDESVTQPTRGGSGDGVMDIVTGSDAYGGGAIKTESVAGVLDHELYDPDQERLLLGGLESLSPGEIEAVLKHLAARGDSLERELDRLHRLETSLRSQADRLTTDREGAGRK